MPLKHIRRHLDITISNHMPDSQKMSIFASSVSKLKHLELLSKTSRGAMIDLVPRRNA